MLYKEINNDYLIYENGELFNRSSNFFVKSYIKDNVLVHTYKDNGKVKTSRVKFTVAKAFIPNPLNLKYVINKDGDIHNNNVSNLVWSLNKSKIVFFDGLEKECSKCGFVKAIDRFPFRNNREINHQPYCIDCSSKTNKKKHLLNTDIKRDYHYKRTYNITLDLFNEILKSQDNKCAICNESNKKMCLDHCHETNGIRGVLCDNCNRSIGLLHDDIDILKNAIKYLNKWKQ